jgi:hypothetical protein
MPRASVTSKCHGQHVTASLRHAATMEGKPRVGTLQFDHSSLSYVLSIRSTTGLPSCT